MKNSCYILLLCFLLYGCSTTSRLADGEILYTGVKKIDIKLPDNVKLTSIQEESLKKPLSVAPNNAIYSPYLRHPFAFGLWFNNIKDKRGKGFKHWLVTSFAKKPVLISTVMPQLRTKMVEVAMCDYGFFGTTASYEILPNKSNSKKAKVLYKVELPTPRVYGDIEVYDWPTPLDSVANDFIGQRSGMKAGEQYDINLMEEVRQGITERLRNRGYFFFRSAYIEFLADTVADSRTVNVRICLKQDIKQLLLGKYKIKDTEVNFLSSSADTTLIDTIMDNDIKIVYEKPERLKSKVLVNSISLRPGMTYSLRRQNRTQASFVQLGVFDFANISITPVDTVSKLLNLKINAQIAKPIDTEIEMDVSSKSNNLLGPGLIFSISNKNLFKRAELLTFKLNGAYEWQIGGEKNSISDKSMINSYEFGLNIGLSVPKLLLPSFMHKSLDRREHTSFQIGADFMNRHSYFRMLSLSASTTYEFNASRRHYHTVVPFKLVYNYLLKTTQVFDSTMNLNPLVAQSFKNQFIPSVSYTYTYDRAESYRNPNRLLWKTTIMQAGNIIYGLQSLVDRNRQKTGREFFSNEYSQFLKITSELITNKRINDKTKLVSRFMCGLGYAYGNSKVMPYSEQFYTGGSNSIRAFQIRSIGPGSFHSDKKSSVSYLDQKGEFKIEANLEYRFKIFDSLFGAVFGDAGNVWLLREDLNRSGAVFKPENIWKELALGSGAGVRYDFTYLIVRLDLGVALHSPYDTGKSGYFNIKRYGIKDGLVLNLAIGYPF